VLAHGHRFLPSLTDFYPRTPQRPALKGWAIIVAEGSQAGGTSKKMELKLTNVARASLEELRLDYEDSRSGFLSLREKSVLICVNLRLKTARGYARPTI